MTEIKFSKIWISLSIFGGLEILSFFAWPSLLINQFIFSLLVIITLVLSIFRLEYGLWLVLGELFIGSMGHLFYFSIDGFSIPIRIALWSAFMLIFVVKFARQLINNRGAGEYYQKIKNFAFLKYFGLLFLFIIIGLINGLLRGQGITNIFNDFNAWFYLLLLFPIIVVYGLKEEKKDNNLQIIFLSSVVYLSLKTLFLLFVFTHNLTIAPDIYLWLRKTLSGEMTMTLTSWPRIFIQSQIYCGLAWFFIFWLKTTKLKTEKFFTKQNFVWLVAAALFFSSLLISFSRSFWVALIGTLAVSLLVVWRLFSFKEALKILSWSILTGLVGFLLIYSVAVFPYPQPGKFKADFLDRISNNNEAALSSRWSLLPVLLKEISREPFLGQGYGATITYFSRDPRVLQNNPNGEYTTYAFEWGYLDIWLKIGFLGLAAYLLLLLRLVIIGSKNKKTSFLSWGLISGLLFLIITNIFTPYLNHPLGFGFLLLASCLIQTDRVY